MTACVESADARAGDRFAACNAGEASCAGRDDASKDAARSLATVVHSRPATTCGAFGAHAARVHACRRRRLHDVSREARRRFGARGPHAARVMSHDARMCSRFAVFRVSARGTASLRCGTLSTGGTRCVAPQGRGARSARPYRRHAACALANAGLRMPMLAQAARATHRRWAIEACAGRAPTGSVRSGDATCRRAMRRFKRFRYTAPHRIASHRIASHRIASRRVASYAPHRATPHHHITTSHHITSQSKAKQSKAKQSKAAPPHTYASARPRR
ncbi:hypothetical protein X946_1905 [Burkholderia sp. ABCPW 111]|nr:hypothetical protein X946_1905 [Burkholderia sp. ABCPW 111]